MDRLEFLVKGTQEEPYRVIIERDGNNLNAFCTCAAAANGQVCKHRLRILSGNPEGLVEGCHAHLAEVSGWLAGTDVEAAVCALAKVEEEFELAKINLANAKKHLAAKLRT